MDETTNTTRLRFYGGKGVTFVPLLLSLCILFWIALHNGDIPVYWAAFLFPLILCLFLAKDKNQYCEAIVRGIVDPVGGMLIISILFFKYSSFARKLYAIGNNRQGAIYAGINVDRTLIQTYMISGALLGFSSAILATAGNRVTCTVGNNLEMTVIAAVVVGGTSATGGSGKIYGSALGALLLAMVSPALTHMGINTYWTDLFTGAIIVLAVITSALRNFDYSALKRKHSGMEVKKRG